MNVFRKLFSSRPGIHHPGIVTELKAIKVINELGPWYHDWWEFGIANEQREGIFKLNQQCKEHFAAKRFGAGHVIGLQESFIFRNSS